MSFGLASMQMTTIPLFLKTNRKYNVRVGNTTHLYVHVVYIWSLFMSVYNNIYYDNINY